MEWTGFGFLLLLAVAAEYATPVCLHKLIQFYEREIDGTDEGYILLYLGWMFCWCQHIICNLASSLLFPERIIVIDIVCEKKLQVQQG